MITLLYSTPVILSLLYNNSTIKRLWLQQSSLNRYFFAYKYIEKIPTKRINKQSALLRSNGNKNIWQYRYEKAYNRR